MKKLFLLSLLLCLPACLGTMARQNSLLPAARMAWPGVRADVERGVADALEHGDLVSDAGPHVLIQAVEDGLEAGNVRAVSWAVLQPYGARGIDDRVIDGEIHPLVAESLRERLRNFSYAIATLQSPFTPSSDREYFLPNGAGRTTPEAAAAAEKH